jgi:hypothetical protein
MNTCRGITTMATANCLGQINAPILTAVSLSGGVATVTWKATPGTSYLLQSKTNHLDPNWVNVPGKVTATSNTVSKADVVGTSPERHYRVMVMP